MPELHFKGKEYVYNHHLSVPFRPLIAHPNKSIGDKSENMIIHGDNLHALKALLPRFAGKVDCIFIDPPYNTGNENWNYNDNVNSLIMKEWLDGNPVNREDMLRHDKWCCLMYPRLKLLSELLCPGGLICIAIDNNELHRLWLLMDEVFGESYLVGCAPWLSEPSGGKEKTGLRTGHEYLLIFSNGPAEITQDKTELGELTLEDEEGPYSKGRELRKWGGTSLREDRPGQWFELKAPDGTGVWPVRNDGQEGHWRWGPKNPEMMTILNNPNAAHWEKRPFDAGVTWNGLTERWVPYEKLRITERSVGWKTWLDRVGYNADATRELKEIFGNKPFDTPKPVSLLSWVINLVADDSAIFLDSFAGSGTTAHALLARNHRDGGNRRFILVECEDYADELTAERVRRVIKGYEFKGTKKEELLRQTLSFTNFRNSQEWLKRIESIENLESHRFENIKKEIKEGELIVTGEKKVTQKTEGLGGDFTYYTLGEPLDIDKILTGESLPDYKNIGGWLFHTATGETLDEKQIDKKTWYLGHSRSYHVWLIYKPDLDFLKSREAALTLQLAQKISKTHKDKPHLVFAPAKFVPNKMTLPLGVEYAPLPFALYRFEKD